MSQKCSPFGRYNRRIPTPDCCIDTYRVYDSCIGQECMRDLYLCLTDTAQTIVNTASDVRVKALNVVWTQILTEPISFQNACYTKNVILYGGEGNISSFSSDNQQGFCIAAPSFEQINQDTNAPRVTVDVAAPIVLESRLEPVLSTPPQIPACCQAIPEEISALFDGEFGTETEITNVVYLTGGLFTMIRLSRPVLLKLENGSFYFPDKTADATADSGDPCTLFTSMPFPYNEFSPAVISNPPENGAPETPTE